MARTLQQRREEEGAEQDALKQAIEDGTLSHDDALRELNRHYMHYNDQVQRYPEHAQVYHRVRALFEAAMKSQDARRAKPMVVVLRDTIARVNKIFEKLGFTKAAALEEGVVLEDEAAHEAEARRLRNLAYMEQKENEAAQQAREKEAAKAAKAAALKKRKEAALQESQAKRESARKSKRLEQLTQSEKASSEKGKDPKPEDHKSEEATLDTLTSPPPTGFTAISHVKTAQHQAQRPSLIVKLKKPFLENNTILKQLQAKHQNHSTPEPNSVNKEPSTKPPIKEERIDSSTVSLKRSIESPDKKPNDPAESPSKKPRSSLDMDSSFDFTPRKGWKAEPSTNRVTRQSASGKRPSPLRQMEVPDTDEDSDANPIEAKFPLGNTRKAKTADTPETANPKTVSPEAELPESNTSETYDSEADIPQTEALALDTPSPYTASTSRSPAIPAITLSNPDSPYTKPLTLFSPNSPNFSSFHSSFPPFPKFSSLKSLRDFYSGIIIALSNIAQDQIDWPSYTMLGLIQELEDNKPTLERSTGWYDYRCMIMHGNTFVYEALKKVGKEMKAAGMEVQDLDYVESEEEEEEDEEEKEWEGDAIEVLSEDEEEDVEMRDVGEGKKERENDGRIGTKDLVVMFGDYCEGIMKELEKKLS